MSNNKLDKDFQDFISTSSTSPSTKMSDNIYSIVRRDLCPDKKIVFLKLLSIQAFIGCLTILLCPQFDMSYTNNYKLFHFFHYTFGALACMSICGVIFIGTGAFFASGLLSNAEMKVIKKSNLLYSFLISSLAIFIFYILGAQLYLDLTMMWFIGALTSSLISFKVDLFSSLKLND